ncbi:PREDICTED: uncharacterized protein LOC104807276 isoform X2 [Tarenaya hassleriana]|uniref:uncharacterized protein LOC104807276 isoform X2 n=1 Tax=Tarenaya hassleriana TaxID=28532 RepID=UPI00053C1E4A|nr:PREDICTED: uncharacterized protein LOC104807276 isoform X2 [Tarenaya hassleriana]
MILSRTSSFYCEYLGELPFIFTFPVTLDHISSTPQLLSLRVHGEFFRVLFLALLLLASPPSGKRWREAENIFYNGTIEVAGPGDFMRMESVFLEK